MTIVDDNFRVINKLEASLTVNARVIIYNCHMFIVPATGQQLFPYILLNGKLLFDVKYYSPFPIISS